jgi:hypothetical protein
MSRSPSNNEDPVTRLHTHYFQASELMRRHFHKLDAERKDRGKLSRAKRADWYQYWKFWLGTLYVVIEGFEGLKIEAILSTRGGEFVELIPQCRELKRITDQHKDSLRLFRNGTFHFHRHPENLAQFFPDEDRIARLKWAEELHLKLAAFFSKYRGIRVLAYLEEAHVWDP